MKKIIAIALVALIVFALAACGESKKDDSDGTSKEEATEA